MIVQCEYHENNAPWESNSTQCEFIDQFDQIPLPSDFLKRMYVLCDLRLWLCSSPSQETILPPWFDKSLIYGVCKRKLMGCLDFMIDLENITIYCVQAF